MKVNESSHSGRLSTIYVSYSTREQGGGAYTDNMVKVMIVEPHVLVRQALEARLRSVAGIEILGSIGVYGEAPGHIKGLAPDVVLFGIAAPDGMAALAALCRVYPHGRIIVLTTYSDSHEEDASLALGASRYLLKTLDTQHLLHEICTVAATHAAA